ncbi:uncharacterized protein MELLADRAFT_69587 [Melampsora larici-populina 98AG31]|uniref:Uncharacterized protein n=1 Tax=Melampsora larici-populina (strain 98AG31 / pathotype 3-4-7) TaxID=747676 RepID=F4SB99_MELLP|nr:uncharacterized protein MELLADRAFT_69587 [Melampsora larici-populina 98AG31]EGF98079.1 hypothetical protein MELLADRAFT_69587 [Melampsora larici-populina 98AG31]
MASEPDMAASINTILNTTSETTILRPQTIPDAVAWHKTNTNLILKDEQGQHVTSPLKAYGFSLASEVLTRHWTYNIHGGLGQNTITGEYFVKHSSITQSLVVTVPPQPQHLAGKAMISGIGKVVKVNIDNLNEDGDWHLTVQAEHDIFNPEVRHDLALSNDNTMIWLWTNNVFIIPY